MGVESKIRIIKEIYRDYADMVYCIALFYMKNSSLAEEMMQDVFVSLIRDNKEDKKISVFELRENQKAWLIKVTVNQCKEYIHTDWFHENAKSMDYEDCIMNGFQTPNEANFYRQLFVLPVNLSVLLYLYYVHGYSHSELAELLDMKLGMVTIRIKKARRLMKPLRVGVE
jgi:RNA polymerase sigma-70 factor (ECF subfamily)